MMKKTMRFALIFSWIVLCCAACGKDDTDELLRTEHVPGKDQAVVYTATPIPSVSPTGAPVATPTQMVSVTPVVMPPTPTEEPEFMNMYRAMPAGTRINTEGVTETDVRSCFCDLEVSEQLQDEFLGQSGLDEAGIRNLDGVRVLYYRNDEKLYICDVIAESTECETISALFYLSYQNRQAIDNLTVLPDALASQGYEAAVITAGRAEYLYIYK